VLKKAIFRLSLLILFVCQSALAEDFTATSISDDSSSGSIAVPGLPSSPVGSPPQASLNFRFPAPEQIFEPGDDDSSDQISVAAPAATAANQAWAFDIESHVGTLLKLRAQVFEKAAKRDLENTQRSGNTLQAIQDTDFSIGQGNISASVPGFGKMKLTIYKGRRIAVFFEEHTTRAIGIFEKGEVSPESDEFRKLVANYHVKGNNFDGRDFTSMELNEGSDDVDALKDYNKATSISDKQWWADQFIAKYENPSSNDITLGLTAGLLQAGATYGIMALHHFTGNHLPLTLAPIALSLGFGTTLGVFGKTYFNLAYDGKRKLRAIKQWPAAYLYSSMLMWVSGAGNHFWSIKVQAASLIGIYAAKKFVSVPWSKTTVLRTQLRENAGRTRFFDWDRQQFERTLLYLVPFSFKNMDSFYAAKEKLPFVDVWTQYIPNIDHLTILNQFLHSSMPYFQIAGVLIATYIHINYLKALAKRPIVEGVWPADKAQRVKDELALEQAVVDKMVNVTRYPERATNYAKKTVANFSSGCAKAMGFLKTRVLTTAD
jgi:hypothetical protein